MIMRHGDELDIAALSSCNFRIASNNGYIVLLVMDSWMGEAYHMINHR